MRPRALFANGVNFDRYCLISNARYLTVYYCVKRPSTALEEYLHIPINEAAQNSVIYAEYALHSADTICCIIPGVTLCTT